MSFDLHPVNLLNAEGAPEFIGSDPLKLRDAAIRRFESETGRRLSPSQVEMYLLEMMAYMLSIRGAEEQLALENNFVAYARPEWLERIGAGRETHRLQPAPATTILRFTKDSAATQGIHIPVGTRVSGAGGQVRFLTLDEGFIDAGQEYCDIRAEASEPGIYANKIPPGGISALIDPVAGIGQVRNITETGGGAALEDIGRYRARVALAFERIVNGLSYERYVADVLSWNARCIDVAVERPAPGHVNISPYLKESMIRLITTAMTPAITPPVSARGAAVDTHHQRHRGAELENPPHRPNPGSLPQRRVCGQVDLSRAECYLCRVEALSPRMARGQKPVRHHVRRPLPNGITKCARAQNSAQSRPQRLTLSV